MHNSHDFKQTCPFMVVHLDLGMAAAFASWAAPNAEDVQYFNFIYPCK